MATFYKNLFKRALEAAQNAQSRIEGLQKDILDLEQSISEKKAALDLAKSAVDRMDNFRPDIGGDVQCPVCWVTDSVHSKIIPMPSDTREDLYRCRSCHLELAI